MDFKKLKEDFRAYKKSAGKGEEISAKEMNTLKEYSEFVGRFEAYKKGEATQAELDKLEEAFIGQISPKAAKPINEKAEPAKKNDYNIVLANYKKMKEAKGLDPKVSYKEIKSLKEAVADANKRGVVLKEADENFMNDAPAGDPNTGAPTANAAAPVNGDIQAQIQSLLSQVQALAAAAGVQSSDLGANPGADVPPVAGQQPAPAPATPDQQMMESVIACRKENGSCDEAHFMKIHESVIGKDNTNTKERIALRSAKLECMNESYKGDFAEAYFEHRGLKEDFKKFEGYTSVPSAAELAKGMSNGAASKETKPAWNGVIKPVNSAPLQGEGSKQQKVKESTEATNDEPSVTDKYVENFYAPKLDFAKIKEAMSNGILG